MGGGGDWSGGGGYSASPLTTLRTNLWTLQTRVGLPAVAALRAIVAAMLEHAEAAEAAAGADAGADAGGAAAAAPARLALDDRFLVLNRCLTRYNAGRAALVALSVRRLKKSRKWTYVEPKKAKKDREERPAEPTDITAGGRIEEALERTADVIDYANLVIVELRAALKVLQ